MDLISFALSLFLGLIPHLISSILSFIFFLFGVSMWLFSEESDFFALIFILIYIGAVAVLFIFVTMLLHFFEHLEDNPQRAYRKDKEISELALASQNDMFLPLLTSELFLLLTDLLDDDYDIFYDCVEFIEDFAFDEIVYFSSHIYLLSSVLITVFFPAFLITSIILLITTVGIFFILFQIA